MRKYGAAQADSILSPYPTIGRGSMLARNPIRCIPSASRSTRVGKVTLGTAGALAEAAGVAPAPPAGNAIAFGELTAAAAGLMSAD
jgi:hypothetical protein